MERHRFAGRIAGAGSTSGIRVVVGRWSASPFGAFTDVMVETAAGHRVLLAPTPEVADFVAATYTFDEVRVESVTAAVDGGEWRVRSVSLGLNLQTGRRTRLGRLLRLVPPRVATDPAWATAAEPISRVVLRSVRTRGSGRAGRRQWYGATDVHAVVGLEGVFDGVSLGELAPVDPPCRFGFSSTPRRPSVTDLVVTIEG